MIRLIATRAQDEGTDKNANSEIHNPYKRVGKTIYSKSSGTWRKKQKGKSVSSAKSAMRLLAGIENGWRPTQGKKRKW
jgi:hypothetical protein